MQGRPLAERTYCFQSGPALKGAPCYTYANLHCLSKLFVWGTDAGTTVNSIFKAWGRCQRNPK